MSFTIKSVKSKINDSYSKMTIDFILNFFASMIIIGMSQLVLYPVLSSILDSDDYGILLTLMGLSNSISTAIGSCLNNTRLLVNTKYEEKNIKGDFQLLLVSGAVLSFLITNIVLYCFFDVSTILYLSLSLYVICAILREYYSVEYRIFIDYKKILKISSSIVLGNIVGLLIFHAIEVRDLWPFIFMAGELFGCLYIFSGSALLREPFSRTILFNYTALKTTILFLTSIFANLLNYLDRIILLPMLGGAAVSIYTVSSCFGKSFGLVMNPLSGVLLSYYVQDSYVISRQKYVFQNITFALIGVIVYLISIYLSKLFIYVFYYNYNDLVAPYLLLANGAAILATLGNLVQPSVLKYAPTYWQLIIQTSYGIVYLGVSLLLVSVNGLMGFAIAAVVSTSFKYLVTFLCGLYYIGINKVEWNVLNE